MLIYLTVPLTIGVPIYTLSLPHPYASLRVSSEKKWTSRDWRGLILHFGIFGLFLILCSWQYILVIINIFKYFFLQCYCHHRISTVHFVNSVPTGFTVSIVMLA